MLEGGLGIALAVLASYGLGAIPTGYWVGRLRGLDIRTQGSGNMGATNVVRVLGWPTGVGVLLFDIGKGLAAVILMSRLTLYPGSDWIRAGCGLAAVMGHTYTCFLKFKGGKGVATACGVFLALAPISTLLVLAAFAAVVSATRFVSAGSIIAAALLPLLVWLLGESGRSYSILALAALLSGSIIYRHRANIARLRQHAENRLGGPSSFKDRGGKS